MDLVWSQLYTPMLQIVVDCPSPWMTRQTHKHKSFMEFKVLELSYLKEVGRYIIGKRIAIKVGL